MNCLGFCLLLLCVAGSQAKQGRRDEPACVEQNNRCKEKSECCNSELICAVPDSDDGTVLKLKKCVDPISVSCVEDGRKCYSDGACCSSDRKCAIPWNVRTRSRYCVPVATGSLP